MNSPLPTLTSGSWALTELVESLRATLSTDGLGEELLVFAYAVSLSGWNQIRPDIASWKKAKSQRRVVAYVGTDHGLTAPEALRAMQTDGVDVHVMVLYSGTYHPKLFWLRQSKKNLLWIGSNNLTRNGLLHNIEFAALIECAAVSPSLSTWLAEVQRGSQPLTQARLRSYAKERQEYSRSRAKAKIGDFTWTRRREPSSSASATRTSSTGAAVANCLGAKGDLVVEVMPKETGPSGNQIQIPKAPASTYFGLPSASGSSISLTLAPVGVAAPRTCSMKSYGNDTRRLQINELDFTDRPCVIVFHRTAPRAYDFEIVSQNVFPTRYATLLAGSTSTTPRSKRWRII